MRDFASLYFLTRHTFVTATGTCKAQLNKFPHTKVQYLPRYREAMSHNLLSHNGAVIVVATEFSAAAARATQVHL